MNVAVYVRVSTQEQKQHGISVDAQESACRAWVQEQGHFLVRVYNDAGLSARAKYSKRKAMLQLIDDIRAGRIELVIFTKLDRWFRNVADYYEVQAILEQYGVRWRAIQEDYETETASGRFKVNIMLAVAQDEADRTSERIKAVAEYKKQKGEIMGRAPVGYKIEDKRLVIDPATEPAMRAFWDTYLATYSRKAAREAAQALGVVFNDTRASRTFRNETYCGNHFGVPCPAYITPEQFQEIRRHVESRTRETKTRMVYLFSGLLKCSICGGNLTSAAPYQKDKVRRIKTYRCCTHTQYINRCPGTYANESKLEQYLVENLSGILSAYKTAAREGSAKRKDCSAEIRRLEGRLSRLRDLYIDGELDRDTYNSRSSDIKSSLQALQAEAEQTSADRAAALELPPGWADTYLSLSDSGKKAFWRETLCEIWISRDQPPRIIF